HGWLRARGNRLIFDFLVSVSTEK
ncbi:lysis protein, partial [Salmonella enterica subsp. enterica serovar Typhimurium]|nr:peptidase [Salmonella enterica subsp. enterica serovar Typhimurium]EBX5204975.1 lysis protein [Salmonella enterica subsp. enterica serovar Typhimurium]